MSSHEGYGMKGFKAQKKYSTLYVSYTIPPND